MAPKGLIKLNENVGRQIEIEIWARTSSSQKSIFSCAPSYKLETMVSPKSPLFLLYFMAFVVATYSETISTKLGEITGIESR